MSFNKKNVRYFNSISIVDDGKNVIKKYIGFDEYYKNKFLDEIIWMIKAQIKFSKNIPKIIDYSLNREELWVKMNYIKDKTVHDHFINEDEIDWNLVFKYYLELIEEFKKNKLELFLVEEWKIKMIDFYLERTINNIKKIQIKNELKMFFENDFILINNKKYPSLKMIINFLKKKVQLAKQNKLEKEDIFYKLLTPTKNRIVFSHLDLIFGNVFLDNENEVLKIIDPRGSFADSKEYGDIYYDYAKIYQCIYGLYDFIIEDRFNLNNKNNEISFIIEKPNNIKEIEQSFLKILLNEIKEDIDVIKLLEAIQFFAMTPAHNDNTNRQIVQICVGICHFVDVIGEVQWKS